MSLHANCSETQSAINKQRKREALLSGAIAVLFLTLMMLLLSLFLLRPIANEPPVLITYEVPKKELPEQPKKKPPVAQSKPSAPSCSMARVIAASAISEVAIPVAEIEVPEASLDFGFVADFGTGWDDSTGVGAGSASFFNTNMKAERVVYVIDYSVSMRGEREKLMRDELARSVSGLKGGVQYQLVFFAGPAWVAGDQVQLVKNGTTKVTSMMASAKNQVYEWVNTGGSNGFKPKDEDKLQTPAWLRSNASQLEKSAEVIKQTPLVYGTVWQPAIEMALRMEPKPNVIFFMTDGVCGGNVLKIAEDIGKRAKSEGVVINTVAMMDPKTKAAMLKMSEESGGSFTLIKEDGKPYDKDGKPIGQSR